MPDAIPPNHPNADASVLPAPKQRTLVMPRASQSAGGLRVVLLAWSLWLLGSWVVVLITTPSRVGATWMALATTVGLVLVYPLARLSLAPGTAPPETAPPETTPPGIQNLKTTPSAQETHLDGGAHRAHVVFVEMVSLVAVAQAVLWPLMAIGRWSAGGTGWLSLWMAGWGLIAGAITAASLARGRAAQTLGMALCLLLLLAEPVVLALVNGTSLGLSPVPGVLALSPVGGPVGGPESHGPWPVRTLSLLAAAALAWSGVLLGERNRRRRKADSML